jgi:hypothetical protein
MAFIRILLYIGKVLLLLEPILNTLNKLKPLIRKLIRNDYGKQSNKKGIKKDNGISDGGSNNL